jgi:hypothetical protein
MSTSTWIPAGNFEDPKENKRMIFLFDSHIGVGSVMNMVVGQLEKTCFQAAYEHYQII